MRPRGTPVQDRRRAGGPARRFGSASEPMGMARPPKPLPPAARVILQALGKGDIPAALKAQEALGTHLPVEVLLELGRGWRMSGGYEITRVLVATALAKQPGHPRALLELGLALEGLEKPGEAEKVYEEGRRLYPDNPDFLVNLACLRKLQLDYAGAKRELDAALALDARHGVALYNRALIALLEHDLDEAARWAEEVLSVDRRHTGARRLLVEVARHQGRYEAGIAEAKRNLKVDRQHAGTWFELGRIYEKTERYREALDAFRRANRLARAPGTLTRERFSQVIDAQWEVYAGVAAQPARSVPPIDRSLPVLVLGAPRSGTTLMERMLDRHPALHSVEEPMWMRTLAKRRGQHEGRGLEFHELLRRIRIEGDVDLLDWLRAAYRELVRASDAGRSGLQPIDKLPSNAFNLGLLATLNPGLPVVHMIRDGREVAWSAFTQDFQSGLWHGFDPSDAMYHWEQSIRHTRRAAELFPMRYVEVRYEALVEAPQRELSRVLETLELPYCEACLDFAGNARASSTNSHAQVRQGLYRSSLRKAACYPELHAQLTEQGRGMLEELGYEPGAPGAAA